MKRRSSAVSAVFLGGVALLSFAGPVLAASPVFYDFTDENGAHPQKNVTTGSDGNIYGTTDGGGENGRGVIYRLDPDSGSITVLHSFQGATQWPSALTEASDGNFYGTTGIDGTGGNGAIFRITPSGQYTVLYTLQGLDGKQPLTGVIQASDGYLYGVTKYGGTGLCTYSGFRGPYRGCGTVFRVDLDGSSFSVIAHLRGFDGRMPSGPLLEASNGRLPRRHQRRQRPPLRHREQPERGLRGHHGRRVPALLELRRGRVARRTAHGGQ